MRINNNMMAMNTHRQLGAANAGGAKSMEKLSSGMRINRAGDDAAGLAISEKMRGQIRGLNQASANAQDGISLIQTAEGALNETHSILQRMRELTVQASNEGTMTDEDKGQIQTEMNSLSKEITRISNNTEFNTKELLNKSGQEFKFQVGANDGQIVSVTIDQMDAAELGVGSGSGENTISSIITGSGSGIEVVSGALGKIDIAINTVSTQRATLGAAQNRLEHTIKNLDTSSENLQASEARIRDVDMAKEMMEQTRQNILAQASTAMLAQSMQSPQSVLQLLR